jgi:hypothetical protein
MRRNITGSHIPLLTAWETEADVHAHRVGQIEIRDRTIVEDSTVDGEVGAVERKT